MFSNSFKMVNSRTPAVRSHCLYTLLMCCLLLAGISAEKAGAMGRRPDGTRIWLMPDHTSALNGQTIRVTVFLEEDGRPLAAKPVTVSSVSGDTLTLTTNGIGVVTTAYKIPTLAPAGGCKLTANFAGDAQDGQSEDSATVKVSVMVRMSTNPTSITGPAAGSTFIATVTDTFGAPYAGTWVFFEWSKVTGQGETGPITVSVLGFATTGADGTANIRTTVSHSSGFYLLPPGTIQLAGTVPFVSSSTLCTLTLNITAP